MVTTQHSEQNSWRLLQAYLLVSLPLVLVTAFWTNDAVAATDSRTELVVRLGQHSDGRPTEEWLRAIATNNSEQSLHEISRTSTPLTEEQSLWAELIEQRAVLWPDHIENLRIPFPGISPPEVVAIVLGNIGGNDAFIAGNRNIAFDLSRMQSLYGSANSPSNIDRADRFFAHEFTHLLHKEWRRVNKPKIKSPLEHALWGCLTEGLGVYRSMSARWTDAQGKLSPHAMEVLSRLQPILVDRLSALEHANSDEVDDLMNGLSMGPFEDKWGALPVALWLALEAREDESALQKWVDAGPWGIVDLAAKYLPTELAERLPKRSK
jgi:hypothetical protein